MKIPCPFPRTRSLLFSKVVVASHEVDRAVSAPFAHTASAQLTITAYLLPATNRISKFCKSIGLAAFVPNLSLFLFVVRAHMQLSVLNYMNAHSLREQNRRFCIFRSSWAICFVKDTRTICTDICFAESIHGGFDLCL